MILFESFRRLFYTSFCTVLDRYFYSQLFVNYIIGVSFFSSIIMINELYYIIRLYFEQNVPFLHVMNLYVALMPFLISFSIPFGVLPAYLLLLGRLSQESELVSMRACGISQFRIMVPGMIFGIMIMFFAFYFKELLEVKSTLYYAKLRAKILSQKPVVQLLDNVFMNIGSVQLSFARSEKVDNGLDVLYKVYAVDVDNRRTIRSEEARLYSSPDNPEHYIIKFLNGDMNQITYKTNDVKEVTGAPPPNNKEPDITEEFYLSSFGSMTLHNYIWIQGASFYESPDTKTFKALQQDVYYKEDIRENRKRYEDIKKNKQEIDDLIFSLKYFSLSVYNMAEDQRDLAAISNFLSVNMLTLKDFQNNLRIQLHDARGRLSINELMKLYERLSLPLSAFVFAILCMPLGMFSARSGRGEGLSISLVVVLVFYGFKSALENMIIQNKLSPEFIWLPTICFSIIALILYIHKVLE